MKETTASNLYNTAYIHFENNEYDHLLDTCKLIFIEHPNSKEAKWALNNFPIEWNKKDKTVHLKDMNAYQLSQNKINIKYAWILNISILILWIIISFSLDISDISYFDRFLAVLIVWLISFLIIVLKIIIDNKDNVQSIFIKLSKLPLLVIGSHILLMLSGRTFNSEGGWWILYALLIICSVMSACLLLIGTFVKIWTKKSKL